jgi:hypothetical protein
LVSDIPAGDRNIINLFCSVYSKNREGISIVQFKNVFLESKQKITHVKLSNITMYCNVNIDTIVDLQRIDNGTVV